MGVIGDRLMLDEKIKAEAGQAYRREYTVAMVQGPGAPFHPGGERRFQMACSNRHESYLLCKPGEIDPATPPKLNPPELCRDEKRHGDSWVRIAACYDQQALLPERVLYTRGQAERNFCEFL